MLCQAREATQQTEYMQEVLGAPPETNPLCTYCAVQPVDAADLEPAVVMP